MRKQPVARPLIRPTSHGPVGDEKARALRVSLALLLACLCAQTGCRTHVNSFGFSDTELTQDRLPSRIAFGSCADQNRPQLILDEVIKRAPDLFIYLGDNIYGDTEDMGVLRAKYDILAARPEFQRLRAAMPRLAIWDDHDYGANDSGRHYKMKAESRDIFLDFWGVPGNSPRRDHPGIYHAHLFKQNGRTLQVILLDTRTFRDDLLRERNPALPLKNDYRPNPDPTATILGRAQWTWLEEQLRVRADLRIVATSIQFGHTYNGWESWTNVPHERARMIDLIRRTRANGVLFISGDVHWGEISLQLNHPYPLFDVTASGLNQDWPAIESNGRRLGPAVAQYNFGLIELDWNATPPTVTLQLIDHQGTVRNRTLTTLSALHWPDTP